MDLTSANNGKSGNGKNNGNTSSSTIVEDSVEESEEGSVERSTRHKYHQRRRSTIPFLSLWRDFMHFSLTEG